MGLDEKTLQDILKRGDFSNADKIKLAVENLGKEKVRARLNATDLSDAQKREFIKTYLGIYPSSFDIQKLKAIDRWRPYFSRVINHKLKQFRFTHSDLTKIAAYRRPEIVGNDVTDFSEWVLKLYYDKSNEANRRQGKEIERRVVEYKKLIKSHAPPSEYGDWKLIYPAANAKIKLPPYTISGLMVNNKPLLGRPDFVFRNKITTEVIIVEIKASLADIPLDGWPNLRAQLWAYGKIDEWVNARRIILIGEIWCDREGRLDRRYVHRWERDDSDFEKFDRENAELFDLYRNAQA